MREEELLLIIVNVMLCSSDDALGLNADDAGNDQASGKEGVLAEHLEAPTAKGNSDNVYNISNIIHHYTYGECKRKDTNIRT